MRCLKARVDRLRIEILCECVRCLITICQWGSFVDGRMTLAESEKNGEKKAETETSCLLKDGKASGCQRTGTGEEEKDRLIGRHCGGQGMWRDGKGRENDGYSLVSFAKHRE